MPSEETHLSNGNISGIQSLVREKYQSLPPRDVSIKKEVEKILAVSYGEESNKKKKKSKLNTSEPFEIFLQHPIGLIFKCSITLIFGTFLIILTLFLPRSFVYTEIFFWSVITCLLIFITVLIKFFVSWSVSKTFISLREIIRLEHHDVFSYHIERVLLMKVKSFDLEQHGFLHSIFDCGNIHVTSMMGSKEVDIVLRNIWPVRKAFALLQATQRYILSTTSPDADNTYDDD